MAPSTNFELADELLKYQTINVDRITDNKCNRIILTRLMHDDPSLTSLTLGSYTDDASEFNVTSVHEMAWLGYFIGRSTHLKELRLTRMSPLDSFDRIAKSFSEGASRNTSIESLTAMWINVSQMMDDEFFQCNHNLSEIDIQYCPYGQQWITMLALTRSLKKVHFFGCQILDDDFAGIMDTLSRNAELEHLAVGGDGGIGRHGLAALLGLLKTSRNMKQLCFVSSGLNDDQIPALAHILKESTLEYFCLTYNSSITSQGWDIFSEALVGHATLKKLILSFNSIGDDVAIKFADALKKNTMLKTLDLAGNGAITEVGWSAFADLLCGTSSIEKTLLSNHTLESLGDPRLFRDLPKRSLGLLEMNKNPNKKQVALNKILEYHGHLDMTPLFEFRFGMLPAVVEWFDRARSCPRDFEANIDKKKLSAVYEFIKGNPEAPEQHWSAMP